MVRRKYWLFAAVAVSVLWISGCDDEQLSKIPLMAHYHFTAECTYCDVQVDRSKITYTYYEPDRERCERWLIQGPCWTAKELKTARGTLSNRECRELADVIAQTGFLNLKDTYGGEGEGGRYYPYVLEVTVGDETKRVEYRSFPDATPMPDALVKVREKLFELVHSKFHKECG